ncbi:MAG: hypothetical protein JW993_16195 [Sedimentisphaerales bacterium]|nr:hypothetical protein [Sedimentisphaerales bacterium]
MKKIRAYRGYWIAVAFVGLSVAAGIGVGQIEPSGRKAGVVQFDAVNELRLSDALPYCVIFARYWVCSDFYAISILWTEPHGGGLLLRTTVILSDENGFRIEDPRRSEIIPVNTTYIRPLGEKGAYPRMGLRPAFQDIRFAEADALSRRVYVSDLAALNEAGGQAERTVNLKVPPGPPGRKRRLAEVRLQAQGRRIDSMELFDAQRLSLGRMRYEYEAEGPPPRLARLVADLPPRPVRLQPDDANDPEIDYVSHKGGRTCTVAYQDVTIGDRTLRLPARIEVRVAGERQLLRSARLLNFKGVDLDKASAWEAARAFSRLDSEFPTWARLFDKYLDHQPKLGPPSIDPNDLASVRRLIAKYPVPQLTPPSPEAIRGERSSSLRELGPEEWARQRRAQSEARREAAMDRSRLARMTPRPEPKDIEPNDARIMRQLRAYYLRMLHPPLTEEERATLRQQGWYERRGTVPEDKREASELRRQLGRVLGYHRAPVLPEDLPPALDPGDLEPIRRLQKHYEALARQTDHGLGGQLRALHHLLRLDEILKDYDAFEAHTLRYLRLLEEADLFAMYMTGGCDHIGTLLEAGQYAKASRLLTQWAEKAATGNDPDAIFHFVGAVFGGQSNPWASARLLERSLRRSGLSALQRYEALALRAIALDKIDKLLASAQTTESQTSQAQARWILSETTRAALARTIELALRQALSAWQTLGSADRFEARPYSTANTPAMPINMMGAPEATPLQETSALLDQIIQQRTGRTNVNLPGPGR